MKLTLNSGHLAPDCLSLTSLRLVFDITECRAAGVKERHWVGGSIVFQKELAINTVDWLTDKDGMGFGKLHTLMKQTCNCVLSKVTETIQTIPFFFSPVSTFTLDCVVLADSCSELAMAFQGLCK